MARSITTIYSGIILEKDNQPALADLTSSSATAIWRLWAYVMAVVIWVHETLWDNFKAEILLLLSDKEWATPQWYISKLKEFQYGDSLVLVNNKYVYAVIDETKRIISRAAILEQPDGSLLLKVAKLSADVLEPLLTAEINAVTSYLNRIKPPGTRITVLSLEADLLKVSGTFFYNAIYKVEDVKADIDAKIEAYISSLPYDAAVRVRKFEDALQSALGYHDLSAIVLEGSVASAISWNAISREYSPLSGYVKMNASVSSMLTFTPVVNV